MKQNMSPPAKVAMAEMSRPIVLVDNVFFLSHELPYRL